MFNVPSMTYVCNGWAMVVCRDGHAGAELTDSCQQVVRFVGWEAFIKSVDLVIVIVVWAALEASLRKFDVL